MAAMMTQSQPQAQPRAYYAVYRGEAGYLTKPAADLLFLAHGATTPHVIEPAAVADLDVLGEVGSATAQFVADQVRGGAAMICTSRDEGRS